MADPRFFKVSGPISLKDLVTLSEAEVADKSKENMEVVDVSSLEQAQAHHVSFLSNKKYVSQFEKTAAGACFVHPNLASKAPKNLVCLLTQNPYKSYALAAQAFYPKPKFDNELIHNKAVIDKTALIGENTIIQAGAVIGANVKIGEDCEIGPNVVISDDVEIGAKCQIGANANLSHCLVGHNVAIYPGVCIGQRGFGFAIDPASGFTTVPQLGRVLIEDDVEVGANTTIDRGAGPDTVIGKGTRIDNLVQIGHNVQIGQYCVIVSQSGVSGSSTIGDFVMIGGQTGIAGHLNVGSGAKIAGQSGVIRDIPAGIEVMGSPSVPLKQFMRQAVILNNLAKKGKKKD